MCFSSQQKLKNLRNMYFSRQLIIKLLSKCVFSKKNKDTLILPLENHHYNDSSE